MDSIRVSEAPDSGSIPDEATKKQRVAFLRLFSIKPYHHQPILTDVIVNDPPTALSLKNDTSSLLFCKPSVYNSGK